MPQPGNQPSPWLNQLSDPLMLIDWNGAILWSNAVADLLFGDGDNLVPCENLLDYLPDSETREQLLADLQTHAEEMAEGLSADLLLRLPDGREINGEVSFYQHHDHLLVMFALEHNNQTETHRLALQAVQVSQRLSPLQQKVHELSAELLNVTYQLADEKNKLATVLANMGEGLLVVDEQARIVQINNAAGRILDVPVKQAMGRSLTEPSLGRKLAAVAQQVVEQTQRDTGNVTRLEIQEKVIELTFAPIQERDHLIGTVINLRDVTKQAEIDRMKSELISIVSHELRSPLANVTGYLDLLLSDPAFSVSEEQHSFVEVAHRNAVKLSRLVDDMLDLSRLDAGKVEMNMGDVDMDYLINFAHFSFRQEAESKQIKLTKNVTGNPHVLGDVDRLQQVLNNLISNAIKYTPAGGQVSIDCHSDGEQVTLAIRDTGFGISPEDQRKLFQRFFRVRNKNTRKITGTGLGLSIAKSVVDAHGGRLEVVSEEGVGSTFTVQLPVWRN